MFFRWAVLDPYGHIYIAPLKSALRRKPSGTNWVTVREKYGSTESYGNFATDFAKARIFSPYIFVQARIEPFSHNMPAPAPLPPPCVLRSIFVQCHAERVLFTSILSVLSERCTSLPHRKWPFNELVEDLNYPRTWKSILNLRPF